MTITSLNQASLDFLDNLESPDFKHRKKELISLVHTLYNNYSSKMGFGDYMYLLYKSKPETINLIELTVDSLQLRNEASEVLTFLGHEQWSCDFISKLFKDNPAYVIHLYRYSLDTMYKIYDTDESINLLKYILQPDFVDTYQYPVTNTFTDCMSYISDTYINLLECINPILQEQLPLAFSAFAMCKRFEASVYDKSQLLIFETYFKENFPGVYLKYNNLLALGIEPQATEFIASLSLNVPALKLPELE